jgi:hypothetical protein
MVYFLSGRSGGLIYNGWLYTEVPEWGVAHTQANNTWYTDTATPYYLSVLGPQTPYSLGPRN